MIVPMKWLPAMVPAFAVVLSAQPSPLVFTHVTVIDATGSPPAANRVVVIGGGADSIDRPGRRDSYSEGGDDGGNF